MTSETYWRLRYKYWMSIDLFPRCYTLTCVIEQRSLSCTTTARWWTQTDPDRHIVLFYMLIVSLSNTTEILRCLQTVYFLYLRNLHLIFPLVRNKVTLKTLRTKRNPLVLLNLNVNRLEIYKQFRTITYPAESCGIVKLLYIYRSLFRPRYSLRFLIFNWKRTFSVAFYKSFIVMHSECSVGKCSLKIIVGRSCNPFRRQGRFLTRSYVQVICCFSRIAI